MNAVLDRVRRRPIQGDETEIARDLTCRVDPDDQKIEIKGERDPGIQVGDEIESDAFDQKVVVSSVRREQREHGHLVVLTYR